MTLRLALFGTLCLGVLAGCADSSSDDSSTQSSNSESSDTDSEMSEDYADEMSEDGDSGHGGSGDSQEEYAGDESYEDEYADAGGGHSSDGDAEPDEEDYLSPDDPDAGGHGAEPGNEEAFADDDDEGGHGAEPGGFVPGENPADFAAGEEGEDAADFADGEGDGEGQGRRPAFRRVPNQPTATRGTLMYAAEKFVIETFKARQDELKGVISPRAKGDLAQLRKGELAQEKFAELRRRLRPGAYTGAGQGPRGGRILAFQSAYGDKVQIHFRRYRGDFMVEQVVVVARAPEQEAGAGGVRQEAPAP